MKDMKAFRVRYGNKDDEVMVIADSFGAVESTFRIYFIDKEIEAIHMMPYEVLIQEDKNE